MLANPKWFTRRKYTGWGITPVTWQGWVYIGCMVGFVIGVILICEWLELSSTYLSGITLVMLGLITAEALHIAMKINKDERETLHEALAERNAAWVVILLLNFGIMYQLITSSYEGSFYVDPFLIVAILSGIVTKGITNWYLQDK